MPMRAADLYRARRIGGRQSPIQRPAPAVVDLTYGFTDTNSSLGCEADAALADTARLPATARTSGTPPLFTRITYDGATAAIATPSLEKMPALSECGGGSRWASIDARIEPQAREPVLTKTVRLRVLRHEPLGLPHRTRL
ncbi:hypothetical protein ACQPZQ_16015 [Pseudonocardia sp. CA-142604]|uniref:hypothetical protein n=1 Tax=Pseudonocardia sp. CA-142604 TaxID=3240024 RepID=UPI003D8A0669